MSEIVIFEAIAFGALGLIVGSFLNVVVIRHNTGRSLVGRSGCMSCRSPLTAYMLIPILSWVLQGRRCALCGAKLSWQYPLVELSTALLFIAIGLSNLAPLYKGLSFIFVALIVCIVAYDIRHTIIPDVWVYAAAVLALIYRLSAALGTPFPITDAMFTVLEGPIIAAPFAFLWFVTRGRGMGLGDAKLALAAGWLLGLIGGFYAVALSFVIGALVSVLILLPLPHYYRTLADWGILKRAPQKTFTMKSEVPFGPFLAAGMLIVWLLQMYGIESELLAYAAFL